MIVVVSWNYVVVIVVGHNPGWIVVVVSASVESTMVIRAPAASMILRPRMAIVSTAVISMGTANVDVDSTGSIVKSLGVGGRCRAK
jgi:hypothetical protein